MQTEALAAPAPKTRPAIRNLQVAMPGNLGYIVGPFDQAAADVVTELGNWEDDSAVADILPNSFMIGIYVQGPLATIFFQKKDLSGVIEHHVPANDKFHQKLRMAILTHPELFSFPNE